MQVATLLMRTEESDGHFTAAAAVALQSGADFDEREVIAKMLPEFGEAEACGMLT